MSLFASFPNVGYNSSMTTQMSKPIVVTDSPPIRESDSITIDGRITRRIAELAEARAKILLAIDTLRPVNGKDYRRIGEASKEIVKNAIAQADYVTEGGFFIASPKLENTISLLPWEEFCRETQGLIEELDAIRHLPELHEIVPLQKRLRICRERLNTLVSRRGMVELSCLKVV